MAIMIKKISDFVAVDPINCTTESVSAILKKGLTPYIKEIKGTKHYNGIYWGYDESKNAHVFAFGEGFKNYVTLFATIPEEKNEKTLYFAGSNYFLPQGLITEDIREDNHDCVPTVDAILNYLRDRGYDNV